MTPAELRQAIETVFAPLHGRGRLLIVPHDNPDPDSLGAALALEAVAQRSGLSAAIGLGGIIGRAENRALVRELGIALTPMEGLDASAYDLIALIDTQPGTGNNSLPEGRRADIVIDHHPPRASSSAAPWCDVREDAGATSTIVHGYLTELGIPLDARLATALLYALKSETRELSREAGPLERVAYAELLGLADHDRLHAIAHPKLGREHFIAVDRALRAALVRGPLLTANLGALDYPDLVAEVADMLMPCERVHWVLCVGQHDGAVFLSIRTDLPDAHAGALIRRVLGGHGAGGGHGMVAGGRLFVPVQGGAELAQVTDELVQRLAAELEIPDDPVPLL